MRSIRPRAWKAPRRRWLSGVPRLLAQEAIVADIEAALAVAAQKDREADTNRRLAGHAAQVASLRQHMTARRTALMKVTAAIQNLDHNVREAMRCNEKMAVLIGAAAVPEVSLLCWPTLSQAIATELARLGSGPRSATNGVHHQILPGARHPSFNTIGNPESLPSLVDQAKASDD